MTRHGLSYTSIYKRWYNMMHRCYNPKSDKYKRYGGRGITVCDEWKNDIEAYGRYVTSLPNAFGEGLTIDRINNDGNYEPGNLRWATHHVQMTNQRKNIFQKYIGVGAKDGGWIARLVYKGEFIYLGKYETEIEAATVRDWYIIKNGLWEYPIQVIRTHN